MADPRLEQLDDLLKRVAALEKEVKALKKGAK